MIPYGVLRSGLTTRRIPTMGPRSQGSRVAVSVGARRPWRGARDQRLRKLRPAWSGNPRRRHGGLGRGASDTPARVSPLSKRWGPSCRPVSKRSHGTLTYRLTQVRGTVASGGTCVALAVSKRQGAITTTQATRIRHYTRSRSQCLDRAAPRPLRLYRTWHIAPRSVPGMGRRLRLLRCASCLRRRRWSGSVSGHLCSAPAKGGRVDAGGPTWTFARRYAVQMGTRRVPRSLITPPVGRVTDRTTLRLYWCHRGFPPVVDEADDQRLAGPSGASRPITRSPGIRRRISGYPRPWCGNSVHRAVTLLPPRPGEFHTPAAIFPLRAGWWSSIGIRLVKKKITNPHPTSSFCSNYFWQSTYYKYFLKIIL